MTPNLPFPLSILHTLLSTTCHNSPFTTLHNHLLIIFHNLIPMTTGQREQRGGASTRDHVLKTP